MNSNLKKFLRPIYHLFKYFIPFCVFHMQLIAKRRYKIATKNAFTGKIAVLANGPSLKEVIPKLTSKEKFEGCDFIVMNLFALEKQFAIIKPTHYCFADPMFYQDYAPRLNDIQKTFKILQEEVHWTMNVYLSFFSEAECKMFLKYSGLTNPNLKIIKTNRIDFEGYKALRNYYYNTGYCMPKVGNVANLAIYISLLNGYKSIDVYGVDHDFFLSWAINERNELCAKEAHFYQNTDEVKLKPIVDTISGKGTVKIATYLSGLSVMFKSHDQLQAFSEYKNATIINMTKNSMIDSYQRGV
jgi:hypothetical protein